jgi:hypothetical protein
VYTCHGWYVLVAIGFSPENRYLLASETSRFTEKTRPLSCAGQVETDIHYFFFAA